MSLPELKELSLKNLEAVVAIESASDESSETIPSTTGQTVLAEYLAEFFSSLGGQVTRDEFANTVAYWPARHASGTAPEIAMMVHLDTARGTQPMESLNRLASWDGEAIPYPENPNLRVSVANYPALSRYLGQELVFGNGVSPFGLDDKLGLTHLMTLIQHLQANPELSHPGLYIIARPDEEIGRMEALESVADFLAERGVRSGYTIDGLDPFEINIENFNASAASVFFEGRLAPVDGQVYKLTIGGVNTHGATAWAEGHRPATRLAAEVLNALEGTPVAWIGFESDSMRDCDAVAHCIAYNEDAAKALEKTLRDVVGPHIVRGASWKMEKVEAYHGQSAAADALRFVWEFLNSNPGFTLAAEDSSGFDGYSQPYRILPVEDGFRLDIRLRDFAPEMLKEREEHVRRLAGSRKVEISSQYINMGPHLKERPELVKWALAAGAKAGVESQIQPIRGGTGVDPFLERGIGVANLGTGYFAPESEKEFTTLEFMAQHVRWLAALCEVVAEGKA